MDITEFVEDTIYTFKLVTAEEIVAKVTGIDTNTKTLYLKTPLLVGFTGQGVQMMPALFTGDPEKTTQLNTNAIVLYSLPRREVANSYIEATTGIKPVNSNILMG